MSHRFWKLTKPAVPLCSGLAAVVAAVAIAACGGSSADEVVARVAGHPIKKGALDHWTRLEAVFTYKLKPTAPVPNGVIPDPPEYRACIAYLEAVPATQLAAQQKLTAGALKPQCEAKLRLLRDTAMTFLITAQWLMGEGLEQGVTATEAGIRHRLLLVKDLEFPTEAAFRQHLALSGETMEDQLFRARIKLTSELIERRLHAEVAGLSAPRRARFGVKFGQEFPRRWAAKTTCLPAYVVPDCSEYHGPLAPEAQT